AGIVAGPDGALWFTEKVLSSLPASDVSKIGRITTTGSVTEFPIPTVGSSPSDITTGPDGALWFTETAGLPIPHQHDGKIGRITTSGIINEFLVPAADGEPFGIAAGPDGNIWFTEYFANKIGRLNLSAACTPSATNLCLSNSRFKVEANWTMSDAATGTARAVGLTSDAGYFWFFSSSNPEILVKTLNPCSFHSSYWVFAAGLTNVNVVLRVTDTETGQIKTYMNPQGTPFLPIQDTSAFACPDRSRK